MTFSYVTLQKWKLLVPRAEQVWKGPCQKNWPVLCQMWKRPNLRQGDDSTPNTLICNACEKFRSFLSVKCLLFQKKMGSVSRKETWILNVHKYCEFSEYLVYLSRFTNFSSSCHTLLISDNGFLFCLEEKVVEKQAYHCQDFSSNQQEINYVALTVHRAFLYKLLSS